MKGLCAAIALSAVFCGHAAFAGVMTDWTTNGVNWGSNFYNPDVQTGDQYDGLPAVASPAWTAGYNTGTYGITDNYLNITTTDGSSERQVFSAYAADNWDMSTNATVEVNLRVNSSFGSYGSQQIVMGNGSFYQTLFIFDNKIRFGGTANEASHDMTEWTTMRIVLENMDDISTAKGSVYFDGSAAPALVNTNWISSTIAYLRFGDQNTTSANGSVDWDYLAWTNVAIAPVGFDWITNGVNWGSNFYNPDVQTGDQYHGLPTEASPAWTAGYNTGSYGITDNYLRIIATNDQRQTFDTRAGGAWDISAEGTVEANLRVISSEGSDGVATLQIGNGTLQQTVLIHDDRVTFGGVTAMHDMTAWTTMRVTFEGLDNVAMATSSIYFDNGATPALVNTNWSASTINYLRFGDQNTLTTAGTADWDYIAWTDTAIAPDTVAPATIMGWSAVSGGMMRMVVDTPEAASYYYLKSTTNLIDGSWAGVAHSDDGVNGFFVTNLSYSTSEGSNKVIYVEANDTAAFFGIGEE